MRKTLIRKSKRSHGSCHYGGDMLLAKYEHEDGEPVFITSEYFFKAKTEGIFRYEHLNKEPKIR